MIENEDVRLRPWMQVAGHLQLSGLVEQAIEGHDFAIVIERSDCFGLTGTDVDNAVAVHRHILARHIQRAGYEYCLHLRVQLAIGIDELKPPVKWKCLGVNRSPSI